MPTPKFKLKDSKPDTDFIQWNETMSHKQDIDLYYEGSHPFIRWVEKCRLNVITDCINKHIRKNKIYDPSIVEVGCGTGHVLKHILDNVETKNLVGVDPLDWWLDKAKARLGDKVKLLKGFAEKTPFENNSFDFAVCTEVIEHVIDPTVVLRELKRIVKNKGLIVVSTPNEKLINELKDIVDFMQIYRMFFSNIPRHNDDEWHIHTFDLNSFRKHVPDEMKIYSVIPVPSFLLPLRYVFTLK